MPSGFQRVKYTDYFWFMRQRPGRSIIQLDWVERVIASPAREEIQSDGRFRLWGSVPEHEGRYLRVILLPDRQTVHNAFFDRSFRP